MHSAIARPTILHSVLLASLSMHVRFLVWNSSRYRTVCVCTQLLYTSLQGKFLSWLDDS